MTAPRRAYDPRKVVGGIHELPRTTAEPTDWGSQLGKLFTIIVEVESKNVVKRQLRASVTVARGAHNPKGRFNSVARNIRRFKAGMV